MSDATMLALGYLICIVIALACSWRVVMMAAWVIRQVGRHLGIGKLE